MNKNRNTPRNPGKEVFFDTDNLKNSDHYLRKCYNVVYYDLLLNIDFNKYNLTGICEIHFTLTDTSSSILLDLHSAFFVDSIVYKKENLSFKREKNYLFVYMPKKINKEENQKIKICYHGKPQIAERNKEGFLWKKDNNGNLWLTVKAFKEGSGLWFPCKDILLDKADSFRIKVNVPKSYRFITNGILERIDTTSSKKFDFYSWKTNYPISINNIVFVVGKYNLLSHNFHFSDSLHVFCYYFSEKDKKKEEEKVKNIFDQTNRIVKVYDSLFGGYPFKREPLKLVETNNVNIESQTIVSFDNDKRKKYFGHFNYSLIHGLAHEWWGNCVTPSDFCDIWLREGFATYSEALLLENTFGKDYYYSALYINSLFIRNKYPMVGKCSFRFWKDNMRDEYMKGSAFLHTFRNFVANDEKFWKIISYFYESFKFKNISTTDFINKCNIFLKQDIKCLFNQYLYRRECPILEYNYIKEKTTDKIILCYKWSNCNEDFCLPVQVKTDILETEIIPSNVIQRTDLDKSQWIQLNPEDSYIKLKRNKKLK